jgi:hypothetical protein
MRSYIVREAEEFPTSQPRERRFTVDEPLPFTCVDLPATRRYSPESFLASAEYGFD